MLNYLLVFLHFIEIFFTNTLLFLQSSLPVFYSLFYGIIKIPYSATSQFILNFLSNDNLNYVTQLLCDTGKTKEWVKLKHEFNLNNNLYFNWIQLILLIPQKWKNIIKNNRISENFFLNHHLIKFNNLLSLEKLNFK